ncbi:hypothetical protein WA158_003729 [Blastocystis sp. Blastoise]
MEAINNAESQILSIPTPYELTAVSELISTQCIDLQKAYEQASTEGIHEKTNELHQAVSMCHQEVIAYAKQTCPIKFNELTHCLQQSNNSLNACQNLLNEFNSCLKNL